MAAFFRNLLYVLLKALWTGYYITQDRERYCLRRDGSGAYVSNCDNNPVRYNIKCESIVGFGNGIILTRGFTFLQLQRSETSRQ